MNSDWSMVAPIGKSLSLNSIRYRNSTSFVSLDGPTNYHGPISTSSGLLCKWYRDTIGVIVSPWSRAIIWIVVVYHLSFTVHKYQRKYRSEFVSRMVQNHMQIGNHILSNHRLSYEDGSTLLSRRHHTSPIFSIQRVSIQNRMAPGMRLELMHHEDSGFRATKVDSRPPP